LRKNISGQSRKYKEIEFKQEKRVYPIADKKINFLHKFVIENIAKIEENKRNLSVWEKEFIESIKTWQIENMSQEQRNTLHDIASRFK